MGARIRMALVAVAVLQAVTGGALLYLRQGPDVVTVDDALRALRAGTRTQPLVKDPSAPGSSDAAAADAPRPEAPPEAAPTAPAAAGGQPAPSSQVASGPAAKPADGVYTYATKGYEETDALGGARRDYPDKTAATIRPGSCGWTFRWQPLEQRWDESDHCQEAGGVSIRRFTNFHEFFKRTDRGDFTCPEGSIVLPRDPKPGQTWSWGCSGPKGTVKVISTFVGVETLDVGGSRVEADHVHYDF